MVGENSLKVPRRGYTFHGAPEKALSLPACFSPHNPSVKFPHPRKSGTQKGCGPHAHSRKSACCQRNPPQRNRWSLAAQKVPYLTHAACHLPLEGI